MASYQNHGNGQRYPRLNYISLLDMNGEMLLTILSSLAQEEVESLSSNVKMGLQMKMKRGELVGFNGCFGYDYHQDTKTITVNETEAET